MTTRVELIDALERLLEPLQEDGDLDANAFVASDGGSSSATPRGDATVVLSLTSSEAAAGTRRAIRFKVMDRCRRCGGTGRQRKRECRRCRGAGVEEVERRLRLQIQPGVESGMRLVVPGAGSTSPTTDHVGDLVVQMQVGA
jgi:DnaJ-class molecular chaperone